MFTAQSLFATQLENPVPHAIVASDLIVSGCEQVTAALGTTPLMLAVIVGALQNIFSKGAKYSLFDPCKEMVRERRGKRRSGDERG